MIPKSYLEYMFKMAAIAKVGLAYTTDPYAMDNFEEMNNITNEMIKDYANVNYDRPNYFANENVVTPTLSVVVVIFDEDRKVLFKQMAESHNWMLIGGYTQMFESPVETARRCCREQSGAETEIVRLIGIADRKQFLPKNALPEFIVLFEGRLSTSLKKPTVHAVEDARFFDLSDLPLVDESTSEDELSRYITAAYGKDVLFD